MILYFTNIKKARFRIRGTRLRVEGFGIFEFDFLEELFFGVDWIRVESGFKQLRVCLNLMLEGL